MRKLDHRLISTICFFISPLFSLPLIIRGIYNRDKWSFFLLSLFFGLWAYLSIPFADLFRHTFHYYSYAGISFQQLLDYHIEMDWVIPFVDWYMVNHNIPYEYLRLFELMEGFFLMTTIFNYMIERSNKKYTKKEVFFRFCILFMFFDLMYILAGVRYGFALCQYLFGLHLIFNKRSYFWGVLFFILAAGIHNSFYFTIPISFIIFFLLRSKKNIIIVLLLGLVLMPVLFSRFGYLLEYRADWYFGEGDDLTGGMYEGVTIYGMIISVLWRVASLPFAYVLIKYYNEKLQWSKMSAAWLILAVSFVLNSVMLIRMGWVFAAIGTFMLLSIENMQKVSDAVLKLIMCGGILYVCVNAMYHKTMLTYSPYEYTAAPIPIILSHHYDEVWIQQHIDNNTLIKDTRD